MDDREKLINEFERYACDVIPVEIINQVEKAIQEPKQPEPGWISVKDRLPDSGKHVLLACEIHGFAGHTRKYVCDGYYAKKYTLLCHDVDDDICYDYSEENDEYYLKEGWYEVIKNWDEYSSIVIGDFVTHWMSLPEPPKEEP